MKINEIFNSCQGEGPDFGIPMIFVRLQGCNLTCPWCDTKYSWGDGGKEYSVDEVMDAVLKYRRNRVYITGGEPLVQLGQLTHLVARLRVQGLSITIATNGTMNIPSWWKNTLWDVDMKCPSAESTVEFNREWLRIGKKNRIKFVVGDEHDLEFVLKMVPRLQKILSPTMLVSPMVSEHSDTIGRAWAQEVWNFCVTNNLRFSLQGHKAVFGNKRGI